MDDNLLKIITESPLADEMKDHWRSLLPKMSEEEKKHLLRILVEKTEVVSAIEAIDRSLDIIKDAEEEAENLNEEEPTENNPTNDDLDTQKVEANNQENPQPDDSKTTENKMMDEKQKVQEKLAALKQELSSLSQNVQARN